MAVAHNSTTIDGASFSDVFSVSHTPAGSDRLLLAWVMWLDDETTMSSVVFNTTESLTRVGGIALGTLQIDLWRRIAPTVTTANVTVTPATNIDRILMAVSSYTGVDQTTPLGTLQTGSGSINPDPQPSLVVSSATGNLVADGLAATAAPTLGAGQTQRWNQNQINLNGAGSTEPGAASITMSWSGLANFESYVHLAISILAGGAGPLVPSVFDGVVVAEDVARSLPLMPYIIEPHIS